MRVLLKYLGIFALLGVILWAVMAAIRIDIQLGDFEAGQEEIRVSSEIGTVTESALVTSMIFCYITAVAGVAAFFAFYSSAKTFRYMITVIMVVLATITWIMTPDITGGSVGPANPKGFTLALFINAIFAAICIIGAYEIKLKRQG